MPGRVFGPLTGSVAASQRQVMVDDFSVAQKGAVLVAQIVAGGVGLNIQAASVVVICEPQLKPTTEWQAIARAHRMGQLESVQVHRLLSDEGVDQRVREILATKKNLFESFARESDMAASAPEAFDITEAELARDIIAAERERLLGGPAQAVNGDGASASKPAVSAGGAIRVPPVPSRAAAPTVAAEQPDDPRSTPSSITGHFPGQARHDGHSSPSAVTTHNSSMADGLAPYPAFAEHLAPISQTSPDGILKNVVKIVALEGPVTGWRVHQVYKACSAGSDTHEEFSRLLNRAISAAEKRGMIVSDNPFNRAGNKPRTFRLPTQAPANVRQLGPRTLDIVPPAELRHLCAKVSGGRPLPDEEVLALVAKKLKLRGLSATDRDAIIAALRLNAR